MKMALADLLIPAGVVVIAYLGFKKLRKSKASDLSVKNVWSSGSIGLEH